MRARLVILGLCLLSLAVGAAGVLYGRWQHAEAEAVRQALDSANAANTALRDRLAGIPTEILRQKEARRDADKAIEANPNWAAEPVPDAVADGLCARLRCR
jgi:Tfp pilus assembly protein PilN